MNLSRYTILNRYFCSLFGAKDIGDFRSWHELEENEAPLNQTVFFKSALATFSDENLRDRLQDYDSRIWEYQERLRTRRPDFYGFKYFQYLALLFSEIYFDHITSDMSAFLDMLNKFLASEIADERIVAGLDSFTKNDLKKLAFYMATGSGKTLLLHVHLWQVQYYLNHSLNPQALSPDSGFSNILLLAPSPKLAEQHINELEASGIMTATLKELKRNQSGLLPGTVIVTDMYKLRPQRVKDDDDSEGVYYKDLGNDNLVFADEGHKGNTATQNEKGWKNIRDYLAQKGFLFEYSATFKQVLRTEPLKKEYGKCIIFDYQYRYFYGDGCGKEFQTISIEPDAAQPQVDEDIGLMGSLLLFYNQTKLYKDNFTKLQEYQIETPLWISVGHTATSTKKGIVAFGEDDQTLSDVAKVINFLYRFLEDSIWAKRLLEQLITSPQLLGQTNPFLTMFRHLHGLDLNRIYDNICNIVFHGKGSLELRYIGAAEQEIGLKVASADEGQYFGLVNIGKRGDLGKLLETEIGIEVGNDPISSSLFENIDRHNSEINILIGSRTFIEGWSSWRVSIMTLLYIGQGKGPQIIQLFGRGVRLKGRNNSLRRSGDIPGVPSYLKELETLFILGIKAEYVNEFLSIIKDEESAEICLKVEHNLPRVILPFPRTPQGYDFVKDTVTLEIERHYAPTVQWGTQVKARTIDDSGQLGNQMQQLSTEVNIALNDVLPSIDWPHVMLWLQVYVQQRYPNLSFSEKNIRQIISKSYYTLKGDETRIKSNPMAVNRAVVEVARRYIDKFYRSQQNRALTREMYVDRIQEEDLIKHYVVTVERSHAFFDQLRNLRDNLSQWQQEAETDLPRLYIDPGLITVLYQPLVYSIAGNRIPTDVSIYPTPLNESETYFIRDLRDYWQKVHSEYPNHKIYLLRNSSKGLGFYSKTGFYPDFVLWVHDATNWRIVFVEPHGLAHESINDNPKIDVFTQLLPILNTKEDFKNANIQLDGFLVVARSTEIRNVAGISQYDGKWDALAKDKHVLAIERGKDANIKTVLGLV